MTGKNRFVLCAIIMLLMAVICGCSQQSAGQEIQESASEVEETVNQTDAISVSSSKDMDMTEPEATESAADTETTEATLALQNTEETVGEIEGTEGEETLIPMELPELGPLPDTKNDDFVNIQWYIPDALVELRYAGNNNFTGETIYNFQNAYLRYGTVCKLLAVSDELAQMGLYLKIWDAFRPASAQFKLWKIFPDSRYVANPNNGYSSHTRGNTVDVTLVDADGNELLMPSEYDDFTEAANRDYKNCTEEARRNALLMETIMEKHGFHGYWGEWWHFTDDTRYEVEKTFDPGVISVWYPDCNEFITLRERASAWSDPLNQIPLGSPFIVLGYTGQFAMAEYMGQRGYVLTNYINSEP